MLARTELAPALPSAEKQGPRTDRSRRSAADDAASRASDDLREPRAERAATPALPLARVRAEAKPCPARGSSIGQALARSGVLVLPSPRTCSVAGSVGDRAAAVLEQVVPDFPDTSQATVAGCTGVALGLLDEWLSGRPSRAPTSPHAPSSRPGTGLANAPAAALGLAGKGAFRSLRALRCDDAWNLLENSGANSG